MYTIVWDTVTKPWWKTIIYGWYLPALFASAWLTGKLWLPHDQLVMIDGVAIFTQDLTPLRNSFMASLVLNGGILLILKPKKHGWIGLTWLIGVATATILYPFLDISAGLGKFYQWNIPDYYSAYHSYFYRCNATTILLGMILSFSLILIQRLVNPKAYRSGSSMILAWLALWIITTAYLSPQVSSNLPVVRMLIEP